MKVSIDLPSLISDISDEWPMVVASPAGWWDTDEGKAINWSESEIEQFIKLNFYPFKVHCYKETFSIMTI